MVWWWWCAFFQEIKKNRILLQAYFIPFCFNLHIWYDDNTVVHSLLTCATIKQLHKACNKSVGLVAIWACASHVQKIMNYTKMSLPAGLQLFSFLDSSSTQSTSIHCIWSYIIRLCMRIFLFFFLGIDPFRYLLKKSRRLGFTR